ncbi:hypothetical protein Aple_034070 [Acrocarpospora pleiomorpha]|uniref:Uncharacterized protein n=1 Tax=Acrocarpospora pleiomorpha TaxID=90975 RepID=A0A5M3XLI4_9ACTN|nr:hypothetical protein [Acrocarpospora pleiomorpha]GES20511.1 hypothetical protein Aple_034070 [Acrocarpospora pleiomorpha]
MGTASTSSCTWVVTATRTSDWSSPCGVLPGSRIVIGTVDDTCPSDPVVAVATGLTRLTRPSLAEPSGSVIRTRSPTLTPDIWAGSSCTVTAGTALVPCSTRPWAGSPSRASCPLTRSALGRNTTWPSGTLPVTGRRVSCCQRRTA